MFIIARYYPMTNNLVYVSEVKKGRLIIGGRKIENAKKWNSIEELQKEVFKKCGSYVKEYEVRSESFIKEI